MSARPQCFAKARSPAAPRLRFAGRYRLRLRTGRGLARRPSARRGCEPAHPLRSLRRRLGPRVLLRPSARWWGTARRLRGRLAGLEDDLAALRLGVLRRRTALALLARSLARSGGCVLPLVPRPLSLSSNRELALRVVEDEERPWGGVVDAIDDMAVEKRSDDAFKLWSDSDPMAPMRFLGSNRSSATIWRKRAT